MHCADTSLPVWRSDGRSSMTDVAQGVDDLLVAPVLSADDITPGTAVLVVSYDEGRIEFAQVVFITGTLFQQVSQGSIGSSPGIAKYNVYSYVADTDHGKRCILSTLGISAGSWSHKRPVARQPYQTFTVAENNEAIRLLRLEFELLYGATGEERFMTAVNQLEALYPRWLS